MKNKFLEFLLETKLKDLTYVLRDLSSERDKCYSDKEEEYPYIDDLFTFLFEIGVSQEQIFDSIRREHASYSLAEMLVGRQTQNDKNKKEKFEMFRPLLESNVNFYKQVMRVFLSDHNYIKPQFKEKNLELFNITVDVGVKKDFFNYFTETEKQTQNVEYKNILIEKGIFNNEYNFEDTLKLLKRNEKDSSSSIVANHFTMYSEQIHELLSDLTIEKYDSLTNKISHELEIKEDEPMRLAKNFNIILYNLMHAEKEKFLPLLENHLIKENIISTDLYSNNAFTEMVMQPKMLQAFLENTNDFEHKIIVRKEKYGEGILINHFTQKTRDKIYVDNKLLHTVLDLIDKHVSDNEENNKEVVMSHIIMNQATKLDNVEHIDEIVDKYSKYMVKALASNNGNGENYFKYDQRLIRMNELKKVINPNLYQKITHKIGVSQKDKLYKFAQNFNNNTYLSYEDKRYLEGLTTYINFTNDVSVLSILNADPENPMWKKVLLNYEVNRKHYSDENIVTYFLRNLSRNDPQLAVMNFLIEDSMSNFYDIKFGTKDILSYYEKNNKNLFKDIVNKILETETSFEALLKNNKPKLKLVQSLEDETIQKKVSYHMLKQKLEKNKSEPEQKLSVKVNKI